MHKIIIKKSVLVSFEGRKARQTRQSKCTNTELVRPRHTGMATQATGVDSLFSARSQVGLLNKRQQRNK